MASKGHYEQVRKRFLFILEEKKRQFRLHAKLIKKIYLIELKEKLLQILLGHYALVFDEAV